MYNVQYFKFHDPPQGRIKLQRIISKIRMRNLLFVVFKNVFKVITLYFKSEFIFIEHIT